MTKSEVMELLRANQNERGIKNWEKLGAQTGGLESYGIGLTQLRKLAKQVGRDHDLAQELWKSDCYDARVIALLIDEPKKITREQAEEQVKEVGAGMLAHVFSSCDATLPKVPFAFELAQEWIVSQDAIRRQCGYGLIYELSKNRKRKEPSDEFYSECVQRIDREIDSEEPYVKLSMGTALMGIGKRNRKLNQEAIAVAERIGPIDYNEEGSSCEPFEVLKHLKSDATQSRLS